MTELGLLSDFFAVCVSPEQIQRLKGGARVPITSLKGSSDIAKQRGQEAKYPTSLLTKEGGAWFSGASRSVINGVLFLALTEMKQEMELIEHYVEQEVIQQFELDALHLSTVYRQQDWAEKILKETENNSVLDTSVDEPRNEAHGADLEKISRKSHPIKLEQDVDDIFWILRYILHGPSILFNLMNSGEYLVEIEHAFDIPRCSCDGENCMILAARAPILVFK